MTDKQERFIRKFTEQASSHDDWREIMEFALPTLKGRPVLLLDLIIQEVHREASRHKWVGHYLPDQLNFLLYELGLGIEDRKK